MFDKIIAYSIKNKFVVGLFVVALVIWGIFSLRELPIAAVPDITNNQVQIITTSPSLATQEVEQFITTPIELSLQNMQQLVEIRSISRFGLSVVTVVFEENMDIYLARQLVGEYLKKAENDIPSGLGTPELSPISTGLGEIFQYVVQAKKGYEDKYPLAELRSIQDWIIKRQLSGIKGVAEVNSLGGYLKQYEVAVNPNLLKSMKIGITDVFNALQNSNENTGGAYIEKSPNTYYIRTNGIAQSIADIENIVVDVINGRPILIKNIARVKYGSAPRYGAVSKDQKEVVGGMVMMLKGANSSTVTDLIKERMIQINKSLPEGVVIEPYLVRDKLVSTAMGTVKKNLLEGGLIVIFILVLMLGNWRAGLIVASVIPLSMLFAVGMMKQFGISANLMSMGAIDFGLIVDGAVIIVEAIVHRLQIRQAGNKLNTAQMDHEVYTASKNIRSSAAFGEIIILMVYIPILALVGIEGKMFRPMAQTVMLAIGGALILSLTYVPMMSALFLSKQITIKKTLADRIIQFFQKLYAPVLELALKLKSVFVLITVLLFITSVFVFQKMGSEFIPTLEEGDFALHQILPPGSSLSQSVEISKLIQQKLLSEYPEVEDVITKIGSAEIPTDPMPVETGDIMVIMKPRSEWTSASSRQEMFEKMEHTLKAIPGVAYEFTQPIQMRFNELMTGSRADIAIKLFGEDPDILFDKAKEAEKIINQVDGIGSVKVEQTVGMPQIVINYKYDKMAQYGLQVKTVNQVVRTAFAGDIAGIIYEGEKRFDLVVRMDHQYRKDVNSVNNLYINLKNGSQVPLSAVANVEITEAPMQISRDNTKRRIVIGVNIGEKDIATLVNDIQQKLDANIDLPAGYYFTYGGQFENLEAANARLSIVVPIALALIFILLFFTFGSASQALLIFTTIPLSAIGGIWSLQLRGMPFSISAGIGFIALFGVAVLNGIVLIGYFNQLKKEGVSDIYQRIIQGTKVRLRPVLITAAVASLGFLPMALSTSGGAEVQRPLATVVIGGLISATFLTLVIIPILYSWLEKWKENKKKMIISSKSSLVILAFVSFGGILGAQPNPISLEEAVKTAINNHPSIKAASLQLTQSKSLQNINYTPGNLVLNYNGDGLFKDNDERVNQLGFIQKFPSPAINNANNNMQDEIVKSSLLQMAVSENELRYKVKNAYYHLQHKKEENKLYLFLFQTYRDFYKIAQSKVESGAANNIEKLSIQSVMNEYNLLYKQSQVEISTYENQLNALLNTMDKVTSTGVLELINFDSTYTSIPLSLQSAKIHVSKERAMVPMIKAQIKPHFNLGYAIQNYYTGIWLHGLTAGIEIPIFNKPIKKKISAQEIQVEIAQAKYESVELQLQQKLSSIKNSIRLYKVGTEFYKQQIQIINPEIERISKLNYQVGEISYLELLNTLNLLRSSNQSFLDQVLAHNKAVVTYQFITNQ